jgi:thiol-disulfide isomerase/thioredoxin
VVVLSLVYLLLDGSNLLAGDTNQVENVKLAPGWELQGLDGKAVHSTDFKGKVVILDFWATWCPPCRAEIPGLIELQKKYAAQGLAVVGVSVDEAGLKTVKAFSDKNGINYPVVLTDNKIVDAYGGIDGLPTTFIIDRNGHIVKQHLGFTAQAEFEEEITPLLVQ